MISENDQRLYDLLLNSRLVVNSPSQSVIKKEFESEIAPYFSKNKGFDFNSIPEYMGFWQSGEFAHILDGYPIFDKVIDVAKLGDYSKIYGGALGKFATDKIIENEKTRCWNGSGLELWLVLFMIHRWIRHTGGDIGYDSNDNMFCRYNPNEKSPDYDSLVHEMRKRLIAGRYFTE